MIFISAIILFGILNPGYSHISQYISELAADNAPNNLFMSYLGIMPFGISIVLFSLGGIRLNKKEYLNLISFSILLIAGLLFIVAGIYNCDQGCSFQDMSQKAIIHNMSAFMAFILLVICQLLVGLNVFKKEDRKFYFLSLGIGIIGIFIFYIMGKTGIASEFRGLFQRLFIANACMWLVIIGHKQKNNNDDRTGNKIH